MANKENCPTHIEIDDVEMHLQQQYQKQSEAYVQAIENYSGPDPLNLWYKYLCWMDDIFNRVKGDRSVLENVLQTCLATFENDAMYKQDRRLLKIFVKFVSIFFITSAKCNQFLSSRFNFVTD